jgi:hypothetical protein
VYIPPYAFHWTTVLEVPRSGVGVRTGVIEHEAVPFAYEPPRIEERSPIGLPLIGLAASSVPLESEP